MQQLSSQDAQFLYMETNKSLSHVTSVGIFDPSTAPSGEIRFKQIIEHVRSRLHTSPIYKRRIHRVPLELDYPYWVDDEHFDIEYHISHGRLPYPADDRQLCIHLARFHSRPLDMQRAPWEMYVIEGIDHVKGIPSGCYAVATKIHHAAADGMAIVEFFSGLYDIDNQGTPAIPIAPKVKSTRYNKPSLLQMTARGLLGGVQSPLKIARSLSKNASLISTAIKHRVNQNEEPQSRQVPNTRFNLETSPHRVFDAVFFKLDDIKRIKQLIDNATINDVVLAISSAALRRYLIHHKELPADSLRAFVPVNTRTKNEKAGNPQTNHNSSTGNNISTLAPTLFTNISDPIERFKNIVTETKKQKSATKGVTTRLIMDITRELPSNAQFLAARWLASAEASSRMTNVCISNVPGVPIPVYMHGAKCVRTLGLGPLGDRMGLFLAATSYDGQLSINATSCRRTMPDIDFFAHCLRESGEELITLARKLPIKTNKKNTSKQASANKPQRKKKSAQKLPTNRKKRTTKKNPSTIGNKK